MESEVDVRKALESWNRFRNAVNEAMLIYSIKTEKEIIEIEKKCEGDFTIFYTLLTGKESW